MTTLHQYQSRASLPRRRLAGVILLPASAGRHQLAVDRVPIAIRPFHSRLLALQGLLAHVHSQLLEYLGKSVPDQLRCHFQTVLSSVARLVGFDANENGLTYAQIQFAPGAKEND